MTCNHVWRVSSDNNLNYVECDRCNAIDSRYSNSVEDINRAVARKKQLNTNQMDQTNER